MIETLIIIQIAIAAITASWVISNIIKTNKPKPLRVEYRGVRRW